jgi:sRNA-binding carbon storage regulator CsrA
MIILSRRLNESIIIADRDVPTGEIVVTVIQLLRTEVELAVADSAGIESVAVVVGHGEFKDLGLGTRVTLVDLQSSKARLGFEVPSSVSLFRKEVWKNGGGQGPNYPLPQGGLEPSPN